MAAHTTLDGQAWLSDAIHLLGDLLGATIEQQAGADALALEEDVRQRSKRLRSDPDPAAEAELQALIAGLSLAQAVELIKAFTHYFALVNLAEQAARLRVLRRATWRRPTRRGPSRSWRR